MKKIGTLILAIGLVLGITGCKAEVTEEEDVAAETTKYTITYDAAGHGTAPEAKTVEEGYKLTEDDLPALTENGFTFGGWRLGEKTVAAGEEVTADITLKADWTEWGKVAKPAFSVASGELTKGTEIEITCATEGAAIYYTTDGTTPTASSTKYSAKIVINTATTIKAFAVKSEMKDSDVAEVAYTVDLIPPADVTNFTVTCIASGTVKLTWTNPTDADFEKVVITYGTDGKVEVFKTATPNNEATVTGLTNGTEYTFTVKAYDNSENASSGVSVNCTPGLLGGLFGTPTGGQTQGTVIKESWMDSTSGNIVIGTTEIAKTSEIIAIPAGTVAAVTMPNDTSWSTYYNGSSSYYQGVFLSGRKVKLDPFVMSQYQVTQKLYIEVMGLTAEQNPSYFKNNPDDGENQENRPVENITWYQACAFCNELTKKTFGNTTDQCVYYSDEQCTTPYTITNGNNDETVYPAYDTTNHKWTKTGYRLPTEAEWEFCARGGDPNAVDGNNKSIWSYAYAGVQTSKQPTGFTSGDTDTPLNDYAWYYANGNDKTHEVGKKSPNTLGLYDMSGNVYEWCYDWYNSTAGSNDSAYTVDGYVQNPVGASASGSSSRCLRGGFYGNSACYCAVSLRGYNRPGDSYYILGFRVCRSSSN